MVCITKECGSEWSHVTCLCGVLVQDSVLAKEEELVGLKEDLAEIQKGENKLRAEKLEFDRKIESINKDIHENKVKIPALRKQVRSCVLSPFNWCSGRWCFVSICYSIIAMKFMYFFLRLQVRASSYNSNKSTNEMQQFHKFIT